MANLALKGFSNSAMIHPEVDSAKDLSVNPS